MGVEIERAAMIPPEQIDPRAAWWEGYQRGDREQRAYWINLGCGFAIHVNAKWLRCIRFAAWKIRGRYRHSDWCAWWRWWPKN
jgi:hypothetical protein